MTPEELVLHRQKVAEAKKHALANGERVRVTHEKVFVAGPLPMSSFPIKYSETLEHNQKANICCRHMENMTANIYKTSPEVPYPDLFIATCTCGRNHYRVAVGGNG